MLAQLAGYYSQGGGATLLLDLPELAGVTFGAAGGVRKLRAAYADSALRVRRDSDNAELDVGFVDNDLDTASLLAFGGAASVFVVTTYDQTGNGNHYTNAVSSEQPRIVNAGTLETLLGKPALYADGTKSLDIPDNTLPNANTHLSLAGVWRSDSIGNRRVVAYNYNNCFFAIRYHDGDAIQLLNSGGSVSQVVASVNASKILCASGISNTSLRLLINDEHDLSNLSVGAFASVFAPGARWLASRADGTGTNNLQGHSAELILIDQGLTTTQLEAMRDNMNAYYGVY